MQNKLVFWVFITLSCALFWHCGKSDEKNKTNPDSSFADIPADWTLEDDWEGSDWQVIE